MHELWFCSLNIAVMFSLCHSASNKQEFSKLLQQAVLLRVAFCTLLVDVLLNIVPRSSLASSTNFW